MTATTRRGGGPPVKTIACRTCGRVDIDAHSKGAFPQGWYFVSVVDEMSSTRKGYRYLGLFCSVKCLDRHLPHMANIENQIRQRQTGTR